MKTRNDFVSNSSSCSFVISVEHSDSYSINDFIDDIAKSCVEFHTNEDDATIQYVVESNKNNLTRHLMSSELLFLGNVKIGSKINTILKADNPCLFSAMSISVSDPEFTKYSRKTIVSHTPESIVLDCPIETAGFSVPSSKMQMITNYDYSKAIDDEIDSIKCDVAKSIVDFAKQCKTKPNICDENGISIKSCLYFISKRTIWNTYALLHAGYELSMIDDLRLYERKLNDGYSIYAIHQNHGGDGMDNGTVYALGNTIAPFKDHTKYEVLNSEIQ